MKKIIIFSLLLLGTLTGFSQKVTLDMCQDMARENFPLLKQKNLIKESAETNSGALKSQYFPQIQIIGNASYQSDVTKLELTMPENMPKIDIPVPDKDQYGLYAEVSQTLYDGGKTRIQREGIETKAKIEQQKIEVELYQLQNKVNQTYFSILLMDEQMKQVDLLEKDLNTALDKVNVLVENGVSLITNRQNLEAELLNVAQKRKEIETTRTSLIQMLALLTGNEFTKQTDFQKPIIAEKAPVVQRPELTLIDFQKENLKIQNKELVANNIPKLNLFFRGGYGKPALNLFSNEFEPYYVAGVQLKWELSRLYSFNKQKKNIDIQRKMFDVQRETFKLNNELESVKQKAEIEKIKNTLQSDQEIIELRNKIKETSDTQLQNGVITSSEFIRNANAESQARQNLALHEMQLLLAKYQLNWINHQ